MGFFFGFFQGSTDSTVCHGLNWRLETLQITEKMFKTWFKNVPKVILAYFGTVLGKRKNAIRRREYQEFVCWQFAERRAETTQQIAVPNRILWISGKRQAMSGHVRPCQAMSGHVRPQPIFWAGTQNDSKGSVPRASWDSLILAPQPVQVTKVGVIFAIEDIAKPGQVQKHSGSCYQVLASEIADS